MQTIFSKTRVLSLFILLVLAVSTACGAVTPFPPSNTLNQALQQEYQAFLTLSQLNHTLPEYTLAKKTWQDARKRVDQILHPPRQVADSAKNESPQKRRQILLEIKNMAEQAKTVADAATRRRLVQNMLRAEQQLRTLDTPRAPSATTPLRHFFSVAVRLLRTPWNRLHNSSPALRLLKQDWKQCKRRHSTTAKALAKIEKKARYQTRQLIAISKKTQELQTHHAIACSALNAVLSLGKSARSVAERKALVAQIIRRQKKVEHLAGALNRYRRQQTRAEARHARTLKQIAALQLQCDQALQALLRSRENLRLVRQKKTSTVRPVS